MSPVRPWPRDLDWGSDWVADAASDLAHFGFLLRDGERPGSLPGPRLLVALRDAPTLEHFDPELVSCWVHETDRCTRLAIDRHTRTPLTRPYSWGQIQVFDRVPVMNRFLSFGGELMVEADDERTTWAALVSPVPIVRWAGHSQAIDRLSLDVGAFFARLKIPVGDREGAEDRIGRAGPEPLYVVFLEHAASRRRRSRLLRDMEPEFARLVDRERRRMRDQAPVAWARGLELADWLALP
jgi:hypothetical protein